MLKENWTIFQTGINGYYIEITNEVINDQKTNLDAVSDILCKWEALKWDSIFLHFGHVNILNNKIM